MADEDNVAVPDLPTEAALVAEALGCSRHILRDGQVFLIHGPGSIHEHSFGGASPCWRALVSLARRLRETEQERDRWRQAAQVLASPKPERDREWPKGAALRHAPAAPPADHITGGYGVASAPVDAAGWADDGLKRAERSFG